ncbi:MAG: hypothetical protein M3Q27_06605, partial [Actinomycetota bacterium]|nr:hypothetical protein [Actinomycetota bacterium]
MGLDDVRGFHAQRDPAGAVPAAARTRRDPLPTALLVGPAPEAPGGDDDLPALVRSLGFDVQEAAGNLDAGHLRELLAAAPRGRVALVDRRWVGHPHALRLA